MKIRTIHESVNARNEVYTFERVDADSFVGDVPDEIGALLLSISRPGEYVDVTPHSIPLSPTSEADGAEVEGDDDTAGDADDGEQGLAASMTPGVDQIMRRRGKRYRR